ncbi:MAG: hypothetical protein AAF789_02015, partial [Bacteroidota bacterium]
MGGIRLFASLVLALSTLIGTAQEDTTRFAEVRSLVSFYEYLLNTLGKSSTSIRDKQVIVGESFAKVFLSPNVQVEDDLLPDRTVITNKDVQAYLRDVDFFFRDVTFQFSDIQISEDKKTDASTFYQVAFESRINGTTSDGDNFSEVTDRFLEVNMDKRNADLKIASVYTTKISRAAELRQWWSSLSFGWINVFENLVPFDSITNDILIKITDIDSLDLSANAYLATIQPLTVFKKLKYLNISNTRVTDLSPIRYAKELATLKASSTAVISLASLTANQDLTYLDVGNSAVASLKGIDQLPQLAFLDLSESKITDFSPIQYLESLQEIRLDQSGFSTFNLLRENTDLKKASLKGTSIVDLKGISALRNLEELDVSNTPLLDVLEIKKHPNLRAIDISGTFANTLQSFGEIPTLEKIVADDTPIKDATASQFMKANTNVVVITNGSANRSWWESLSTAWKNALELTNPSNADLTRLLTKDSLNLSGTSISSLQPIIAFRQLTYLDVSRTKVEDLKPIAALESLRALIANTTLIKDCGTLNENERLQYVDLSKTRIISIRNLEKLDRLRYLNIDETAVKQKE